ncbi:Ger(x)C family spore germination protein [Tumebacillus flagellatus]|uniref:Uncharacterized protein n=1 Tax=Tumebacillus flagellatus TaxID=1157490 RepID=A0A074LTK2_9BACL|nr:Ger(x)C family spore germination protein [Tumebacillus flagellatus]KEO83098.1 hypothetical protein EL26_11550 [Tumebacillus flagellatus]
MKYRLLPLLLSISLCTTGCLRTNILEQTGLIVMVGFDKAADDQIQGTSLLYQIDPRAKEKTQVITSVAASSKGSRDLNNLGMAKRMVSGQLRVALYSDELVRQTGMLELADTLSRDANVGRMLYVAICKGKALDLMSFRYPEASNLGTFLYQDLKQNAKNGTLPSSTLHEFIRDYYEIGRDPVLPILEKEERKVVISGIALMRNDLMVGEVSPRSGYYIKVFRDQSIATNLEVRLKSSELQPMLKTKPKKAQTAVVITTLKQHGKIKLTDPKKLNFDISLKINAEMLEISEQVDLSNPETEPRIAQLVSRQLTRELQQLLDRCIAKQTDPIGLGEVYRASVRHSLLNRGQWHRMLSNVHVTPHVDVTFVRSGVVE